MLSVPTLPRSPTKPTPPGTLVHTILLLRLSPARFRLLLAFASQLVCGVNILNQGEHMQINLQEQGNSIKAFINVAGIAKDTDPTTANKLIEEFVAELNSGKLTLTSFKDTNGKWVIGWK